MSKAAAVLHLLLQEVPLAVADKPVARRWQEGGVHSMRDAGQQWRGLFLLRRHGLDGLLLILGQQEVARRQLDGADRWRLSEAPVNAAAFCSHQRPKIRLVQVAGRLGLVVVSTKAVLEGQRGAEAVRWLYPSKVLPEGVHRTPYNHLSVQRVHRTVRTVVNIRLQEKNREQQMPDKSSGVWVDSYLTSPTSSQGFSWKPLKEK